MIDGEHTFPFMVIRIISELSSENFAKLLYPPLDFMINFKMSFIRNFEMITFLFQSYTMLKPISAFYGKI